MRKSEGKDKYKQQEDLDLSKNAPEVKKHGRLVKRLDGVPVSPSVNTKTPRKIQERILNCMWRNKVPYATALKLVRPLDVVEAPAENVAVRGQE